MCTKVIWSPSRMCEAVFEFIFSWILIFKFYFQKTDVFLFLIRQLQLYLPIPKDILSSKYETAKGERADQLEFVNLVLETLALSFRETEILPSRLQCLKVILLICTCPF